MGRSRKTVTKCGMAVRSSQLPNRVRAKQKGQLRVRDGDGFPDPRYFTRALDQQGMWEGDQKGTVQPRGDRVL